MQKKRDPYKVMSNINDLLPEELKSKLADFIDVFTAPELIFSKLSIFCQRNVPYPPQLEWHYKVLSELSDQPIDTIKEAFAKENK